ncbi:MAG: hypothetical protein MUF14_06425 [Hyphomonadaceae bacterium]|nr:hypothetical protein [Hyphomonadaceae bacterium]
MLLGFVLSAIAAGAAGLLASIIAGHPLMVSLMFYSLSGCCGVLAFAWHAVNPKAPQD